MRIAKRTVATLAAVAFAGAALAADPASQPATGPKVRIGSTRLGNVYTQGEAVSLKIESAEPGLRYTVHDAWGTLAQQGAVPAGTEVRTLTLPAIAPGFYTVGVSAGEKASATTRLAVLSPYAINEHGDTPFGAMTHFSQNWDVDLLELIARAGISDVRDEAHWSVVEKTKGAFNFTRPDAFFVPTQKAGIFPLIPLTFGNPHYDHLEKGGPSYGIAPYTASGIAGYARYSAEVAGHYKPRAVEIWNEYNGGFAQGPADGKPEVYAQTAKAVYPEIKKASPKTLVLGCSTIGIPLGWIEDVFKAGGLDAMDGVSIHPYGYSAPPENHEPRLIALNELIKKYNNGKPKPVWVTEQGWFLQPVGAAGNHDPITEMTKARYLVRAWTLFTANGVDKSFWYLARDYAEFGTMGLLGKDTDPAGRYAPHESYVSMAVMIRQLAGAMYASRDESPKDVRSYLFKSPKGPVRVVWTMGHAEVGLVSNAPLRVVDLFGGERIVSPHHGVVQLGLSESPVYVHGEVGKISDQHDFKIGLPTEASTSDMLPALDGPLVFRLVGEKSLKSDAGGSLAGEPGERWTAYEVREGDKVVFYGSALTHVQPPAMLAEFPHYTGPSTLTFAVRNASLTKKLKINAGKLKLGEKAFDVNVPETAPGRTARIEVWVPAATPWTLKTATLELAVADAPGVKWSGEVSYNPISRRDIAVDGDVKEWSNVPALDLAKTPFKNLLAELAGDADLSGTMQLAWDKDNLYVAARIVDDTFSQEHTGTNVWKGDNLQLGLSAAPPWVGGDGSQTGLHELGLSLTRKGPEYYRFSGPGDTGLIQDARLVVKRIGTETLYECSLPWAQLRIKGAAGESLSFGVFVNDSDGAGRRGYRQWADIKNIYKMQPCVLVEGKP